MHYCKIVIEKKKREKKGNVDGSENDGGLHLMHITVISMFYTGLAAVVATYYSNSLWVNHCICQGETESQEIDSKFPSSLSSSSIEGRSSTPLSFHFIICINQFHTDDPLHCH